MSILTVLVANRGEIAVRVIRTLQAKGYRSVAVYSTADKGAPHVALADVAVCIGEPKASESYLNVEAILKACQVSGADAVHPGYGFLSENAEFAEACERAHITFIGPSSEVIRLMGSKQQAKQAAIKAGVPCIPGVEESADSSDVLLQKAKQIGFPLMIKATAGGGGRGMRRVDEAGSFISELESARAEAKQAFGADGVILEKVITGARHIEVQVMADGDGNCLALGERDCTLQRRFQKVIEEAPAQCLTAAQRQQVSEYAVQLASTCNYRGAGTVEFLFDPENGAFYFLEMNTRLQVEHPVTECVTGRDLVAMQLDIAAGKSLALSQDEISCTGHAIEARLYAEDPAAGFMPQTGTIELLQWPEDQGVRIDSGVVQGQSVSAFYDPMLAKIIVHADDRDSALTKMSAALRSLSLLGVVTNQSFLKELCADSMVRSDQLSTTYLDDRQLEAEHVDVSEQLAMAAVIRFHADAVSFAASGLSSWRNGPQSVTRLQLAIDDNVHVVSLMPEKGTQLGRVALDGSQYDYRLQSLTDHEAELEWNGINQRIAFVRKGTELMLTCQGKAYQVEDRTYLPVLSGRDADDGVLLSHTDAAVVSLKVKEGEQVVKGQVVLTLEAMKMEHSIKVEQDGLIQSILVQVGDQVARKQPLIQVEATE